MNQFQNQIIYNNNNFQGNKINPRNEAIYYQFNNSQNNFLNENTSLYSYDKRLVLCLKYLGLNKYINNFIKNGIRFEDFLAFSNSDLASFKIPPKIQDIIQKFILAYFNYGSMYTIEEIIQFFKTRKVKKYFPKNNEFNVNERNRENRNNIKYKSVNQRNHNKNNQNINNIKTPKSQINKFEGYPNNFIKNNQTPKNPNKKILSNNNNVNINANKVNNFRISSKKIANNNNNNNIKRKNINSNIYGNITNNSNLSSLPSNKNNLNIYSPSIDNFSHMAMKANSPQLLNIMKMAKNQDISNNNNINHLKKNLVKSFSKTKKGRVNKNNENMNNRNKKIIKDIKYENMGLSKSTSKNIIDKMDEVLQRYKQRKNSNNTSINLNMNNKGYYSDGYLKDLKEKKDLDFNINNNNLEGYEVNTFYTGDTSKYGPYAPRDNLFSEMKEIKKGKGYITRIKAQKINDEQKKKVEYLLSHGGNSSLKSYNNNYIMMNDYDLNQGEEMSLRSDYKKNDMNNNYTNIKNNMGNPQLLVKKNNYINQVNNNINNFNSTKQKNLLIPKQNYKNKIIKNRPNNFNTHSNNKRSMSKNYYQNNDNNIIHIKNQQIKYQRSEGPVQISIKDKKKIRNNHYINVSPNYNFNIPQRGNNYNMNNNSLSNLSMRNQNANMINYPMNNYLDEYIDMNNNNNRQKRIGKSYDKNIHNRVYSGIHNINNNINNININNINYDGKRLSEGFNDFNNLGELDMKMNYHRTQDNFYDPGNLLNNNDIFSDYY